LSDTKLTIVKDRAHNHVDKTYRPAALGIRHGVLQAFFTVLGIVDLRVVGRAITRSNAAVMFGFLTVRVRKTSYMIGQGTKMVPF
jgi:hypothetical protein